MSPFVSSAVQRSLSARSELVKTASPRVVMRTRSLDAPPTFTENACVEPLYAVVGSYVLTSSGTALNGAPEVSRARPAKMRRPPSSVLPSVVRASRSPCTSSRAAARSPGERRLEACCVAISSARTRTCSPWPSASSSAPSTSVPKPLALPYCPSAASADRARVAAAAASGSSSGVNRRFPLATSCSSVWSDTWSWPVRWASSENDCASLRREMVIGSRS